MTAGARFGDRHELAALRSIRRRPVVRVSPGVRPRRGRKAEPPPTAPEDMNDGGGSPMHTPGVVEIDERPNGETVWHCELPHGQSGKRAHGNRWDGRLAVDEAARRHLAAQHPDLNVEHEMGYAWARANRAREQS